MEQLEIPFPLFSLARQVKEAVNAMEEAEHDCICWLMGVHGLDSGVTPYVRRLFREFGRAEAWDRARVLRHLAGTEGWCLEDAEYIGIFDHSINDYHVLWDRGWAIRMLCPRELVPKVWRCSYGGSPMFYDRDGAMVFQSVYSANGHPLSMEERRMELERSRTRAGAI